MVRKFVVEIDDGHLHELRDKLNEYYKEQGIEAQDSAELIRDLFYVELGMFGCVDVRDGVRVEEVKI